MTSFTLPIFTSIWLSSGAVLAFFWRDMGEGTREMEQHVAARIRTVNAKQGLGREIKETKLARDFLLFGQLGGTKEYAELNGLEPSSYQDHLKNEVPYPWPKTLSLFLQVASLGLWLAGIGAFLPGGVFSRIVYLSSLLTLTALVIGAEFFASV